MTNARNILDHLRLKTNLEWIPENTIYLTTAGSHAYGTNSAESDLDVRGIAIPPVQYWLGFVNVFEQVLMDNKAKEKRDQVECTIFNLKKFANLAADCNPNVIELLYTDMADVLFMDGSAFKLRANRDLFLSKKAKFTFSGYAMSQLKRIKTHRKWLLNPPTHKPERIEFGLKETTLIPKDHLNVLQAGIRKKIDEWNIGMDDLDEATKIATRERFEQVLTEMHLATDEQMYVAAGRAIGANDNLMEIAMNERKYHTAMTEFQQFQSWKETRNEKRADLEAKFGYDTKHGMHLVRLMRMCKEILEGKGVIVKRPDAQELLEIRNGMWNYDRLMAWAEQSDSELNELYNKSPLPKASDRNTIDKLIIEIVQGTIK